MSKTYKDKPVRILYAEDSSKKPRIVDTKWHWEWETPSWWTNLFMTRPQRRKAQKWEREVQKTEIEDLEDLDTPNVSRKPHKYYH